MIAGPQRARRRGLAFDPIGVIAVTGTIAQAVGKPGTLALIAAPPAPHSPSIS